jgi:hypothetical protein
MKMLTIVIGNFNNYTGEFALSGKLDAAESGFCFMGIVGFKIIFNWLKYPNTEFLGNKRNSKSNQIYWR